MFALSPDPGPPYHGKPRLIRFEKLPALVIATLDRENNLLRVDPGRWQNLSEDQQDELLRTHAATVLLDLSPGKPASETSHRRVNPF